MGMDVMGNTGIVSGGHAGITPTIELNRNNNCGDGMMGGQWLWAIILLALLGRRGFGEGDGCHTGAGLLPVQAINQNTDWNNLLTNQNINQNAQLAAVAAAKNDICTNREVMLNGFGNVRYENAQQTATLGSAILENRYQMALGLANTDAKMAACCCEQKMLTVEQTQKVLDAINCEARARDAEKIAGLQNRINILETVGALSPKPPVAAYPVWNNAPIFTPTVSAQSFCGATGTAFGATGCGL